METIILIFSDSRFETTKVKVKVRGEKKKMEKRKKILFGVIAAIVIVAAIGMVMVPSLVRQDSDTGNWVKVGGAPTDWWEFRGGRISVADRGIDVIIHQSENTQVRVSDSDDGSSRFLIKFRGTDDKYKQTWRYNGDKMVLVYENLTG